jgi:hypothetical protein
MASSSPMQTNKEETEKVLKQAEEYKKEAERKRL